VERGYFLFFTIWPGASLDHIWLGGEQFLQSSSQWLARVDTCSNFPNLLINKKQGNLIIIGVAGNNK
jgi:hypothetical protein